MARFDVKIIPTQENTASLPDALVIAESEFGEAALRVPGGFLGDMRKGSGKLRGQYFRALRGPSDEARKALEAEVQAFGNALFGGIFKGPILKLFNRTIGGSEGGQLDIRLMPGIPHLNSIHWEVMRCRDEYLGFRHNLIRHPFVVLPAKAPDEKRKKLHILVVAVDPINGEITIDREHRQLTQLLEGFGDQVKLTKLKQEHATVDNIIEVLFEGVDIWHFTGHGMFDPDNPSDSALIVWGDTGTHPAKLSVRTLNTLAMSQSIGFGFLNSCNTARIQDHPPGAPADLAPEHFVNMAHSLIQAGVPMVVATNHEITVEAATRLSKRFYTSVIKYGKRVDQAIREARAELYMGGEGVLISDWSCPVLYARSRQLALGTEMLHWADTFDLYGVRNVQRPPEPAAVR
jgi:hypothetical protein